MACILILGLSLRKACNNYADYKRNHVSIWNWIQKYHPKQISSKRKRISEFIVDETLLKVGSEYIWLWVAIESETRQILALSISKERNMFVAERYLSGLVKSPWKASCIYRWRNMVSDGL